MKDVDKGQNNLLPSKGLLDDLKMCTQPPKLFFSDSQSNHRKVNKQIQRVLLFMQTVFTRPDFAVETEPKCFSVETVTKCFHILI